MNLSDNYTKVKILSEDGAEIEDIIQMMFYLDGIIVLTKNGSVYTNATLTLWPSSSSPAAYSKTTARTYSTSMTLLVDK